MFTIGCTVCLRSLDPFIYFVTIKIGPRVVGHTLQLQCTTKSVKIEKKKAEERVDLL